MALFFIGILEMIIITTWTKVVTENRVVASGVVTMINILIWYYVLQRIIEDITNWQLIILYAFGCAIGTMLTTASGSFFARRKERVELNQDATQAETV